MEATLAGSLQQFERHAARRSRLIVLWSVVLSALSAAVLVAFPPGWFAVTLVVMAGFAAVTWHRPEIGLASVLGATLLFEQFDYARFTPLTRTVPLFDNLSRVLDIDGLSANTLEVMLLVLTVVVAVRLTTHRMRVKANPLAGPVGAFAVALMVWTVWGVANGGDFTIALWELRGLGYFTLLVLLVPQVVVTWRHVSMLVWVAVIVVGIKAAQGAWNYIVVLGGDLSAVRSVTSHEDALFIAWMLVGLLAFQLYDAFPWQRRVLWFASPVLFATFLLTDRRAAFVALVIGVAVVFAWVDRPRRALLARWIVPPVVAVALVVLAGWNASGPIGVPAQMVKSVVAPTDLEDVRSSGYRRAEEANLIRSIKGSPVIGLGFGNEFQAKDSLVEIGFSLADYIPHNEIMWIWAKTGTMGFALFWVMIGSIIVFGGVLFRRARTPAVKALALLVPSAVAMQMIVAYVDLQLTYARNMVFLGVLVGMLACLPALDDRESADAR